MICLSHRFFLTLFFNIFLRTFLKPGRLLLVFLFAAAFWCNKLLLCRLNLLLSSASGSSLQYCCFTLLCRLNLLLSSASGSSLQYCCFTLLCRLELLNHRFSLTRSSRRRNGIDR